MSMLPTFKSDKYTDGRTKQAFRDSTDINKLLAQAAKGDTITHLAKHGAIYGDFSDIDDLLTGMARLKKGEEIFADLPGEIRREFNQSAGAFFKFVNDPANKDRLVQLLPALAARGNQLTPTTAKPPEETPNPAAEPPDNKTPPVVPAAAPPAAPAEPNPPPKE